MSTDRLSTHTGDNRQKTNGFFIGGDMEICPPPNIAPPAATSSVRKTAPRPPSSTRLRVPGKGTSARLPIRSGKRTGRDNTTRMITIVALGLAGLGVIGLMLLLNS